MISVEHLTKAYGEHVAVKDITFSLEKGTICGFLGPNGAGKSTTMNMITGYLAPTFGNVIIEGENMQKSPQKAKKFIGYLPEIPPVYPDMTVTEYLDFVCDIKGVPKKDKAAEILRVTTKTSLVDVKDRLIKNLSKGYRQRVGISQALVGNPPLLILDEPTVGLDPRQIVDIRKLILELKEDHVVILSTHILSEVEEVCDKILIVSHGHIVADDTPQNLEKAFNSNQTIDVVVGKTNSSSAEQVFSKIDGIDNFKITKEESETISLSITAKEGYDLRESIYNAVVANNYLLLELKTNYVSLEDIYLKLTGEMYYEELLLKGVEINESNI